VTEQEAAQLVMGALIQNARGDGEALYALAATVEQWDAETIGDVMQAAISIAYAAHVVIAEITGEPLEDLLKDLALCT